jgi:hypothetical protein
MSTDTRTQAERDYDAQKDGSAYTKPTDEQFEIGVRDGLALGKALQADEEDTDAIIAILEKLEGDDEEEDRPIPAELAGADPDQPFIGHEYPTVSLLIDRRDGGMMIARTGEIGARLLECDEVIALHRFLGSPAVERVIMYHWRQQMRQTGSPLLNDLIDWIDEHFAAEAPTA